MNLLGTHDTERILTVLGGEDSDGKTNDYLIGVRLKNSEKEKARKKLYMAYTISATLPGIPAIFYGDEAGLEGYSDPFNRRTYPWDKEDREILSFYKKIGKIRRKNPIYKGGAFAPLLVNEKALVFKRFEEKDNLITAVNNSNTEITLIFKTKAEALIGNYKGNTIKIPPYSAEIIKTTKDAFNII